MSIEGHDNKRILPVILLSIASILMILSFSGRFMDDGILKSICNFFVGSFGMSFFGMMIAVITACILQLVGKSITIPARHIVNMVFLFITIVLVVHMYSSVMISDNSYQVYVKYCYNYYLLPTFGGAVFGSIVFALQSSLTIWGASCVLIIALAISVLSFVNLLYGLASDKFLYQKRIRTTIEPSNLQPSAKTMQAVQEDMEDKARQEAISILFSTNSESSVNTPKSSKYEDAPQSTLDDILSTNFDLDVHPINNVEDDPFQAEVKTNVNFNQFFGLEVDNDDFIVQSTHESEIVEHIEKNDTPNELDNNSVEQFNLVDKPIDIADIVTSERTVTEDLFTPHVANELDKVIEHNVIDEVDVIDDQDIGFADNDISNHSSNSNIFGTNKQFTITPVESPVNGGVQLGFDIEETAKLEDQQSKIHRYAPYNKPMVNLLDDIEINIDNEEEFRTQSCQAIVKKLAVFGIKTECLEPIVGSSVTQYRLKVLSDRTRMSDFKNYADDLKSCLASKEDIRIEAPIPGTSYVGIEVANKNRRSVVLRSLLESKEFTSAKGDLVFAVGQDIIGNNIIADLSTMPHLLIAGTTGSGKSVVLNNLIVSMMFKYSPEYLRFLMVDPKFVELSKYNGTPHLLTSEAITNVGDALAGLDYLIAEMENRFMLFRDNSVSNIAEFNKKINPKYIQKLPYIVFVVDELADLMATSKKAVEQKIIRLAQKSRACGIHIVLATQRPSVDIVTGVIKANLPSRMALKVSSFADSKTILDGSGAEKLLGRGDMLLVGSNSPNATRVQGAFVSNDEIYKLVDYIKSSNEAYFSDQIASVIFESKKVAQEEVVNDTNNNSGERPLDELCKKSLHYWLTAKGGRASIASIQRSLNIGFNRAGKIFDSLVELGYIESLGANETNTKPRMVKITLEELDTLFPDQSI